MKAAVLVRRGAATSAFEFRDIPDPLPGPGEVRIHVEYSGVNFADVLARQGLYRDLPTLPVVLGYEVVGRIDLAGSGVRRLRVGDRVVAMTEFGGYAASALAKEYAVAAIPDDFDGALATALGVQYVSAWYAAEILVRLFREDHVLIHGASGGLGNALIQIVKRHGCRIYGTTSSPEKLETLRERGVDYPLCVTPENFEREVGKLLPDPGLDVIFNPLGGSYVRKGIRLLRSGGRMICLGVAEMAGPRTGLIHALGSLVALGVNSPASLMLQSKSILGVNMLRVSRERPDVTARALREVVARCISGELQPVIAAVFPVGRIGEAHELLETKKTSGKVALSW